MSRPNPALLCRRPRRPRPIPLRGGPPPGPRYPIGVNVFGLGFSVWDQPDILACGPAFRITHVQSSLAEPYVAGSGVLHIAGLNPFTWDLDFDRPTQNGATATYNGFLNTAAGPAYFAGVAAGGSPYVTAVKFANPALDAAYPVGTLVNDRRGHWTNDSKAPADWPLRPELVADGRRTGYPAGLGAGQSYQLGHSTHAGSQPGTYTVLAAGTGTLKFVAVVNGQFVAAPPVNVQAGVADRTFVLAPGSYIYQIFLVASSPSDPLHDIRIVCPNRPGTTDDFVGMYAAHAADPQFVRFHPEFIDSLKPFSPLRFMDLMWINSNPMHATWDDRPRRPGVTAGMGIPPYEDLFELANEADSDAWLCVPATATDDYVRGLVALALAKGKKSLRFILEFANEVWNSIFGQYYFAAFQAAMQYNRSVVRSITYKDGVCTATLPGHGWRDGATIQHCNAGDDAFNGAYPITLIDADTYSYVPATAPQSTAASPVFWHTLMALDVASPLRSAAGLHFDGRNTVTITTPTPHRVNMKGVVQVAGAADPAFNGLWMVWGVPSPTTISATFTGQSYNRPYPAATQPGGYDVPARAGQSLAIWNVGVATGTVGAGQVSGFGLSGRWYADRAAQVHRIAFDVADAAGQADRLVYALAWQMPFQATSWQVEGIIQRYLQTLGGKLPKGEHAMACAPYFGMSRATNATWLGKTRVVTALACAAGVATATATNHGYADGARVQILNVTPAAFCGVVTIRVLGPDTFQYPVPANPKSPGKPAGAMATMVAALEPPYIRELTAASINGDVMTCTSPGHGWRDGLPVHLCGPGATAPNRPAPANYGAFAIRVLDPDHFAVTLPAGAAAPILPTDAARMWARDDRLLDDIAADVELFTILSQYFAGAAPTCRKYGMSLWCYEGGANGFMGFATAYPPIADVLSQYHNGPRMGVTYGKFIRQLYSLGTRRWCQFNHIDPYYWWGGKGYQGWPDTPKLTALTTLSDRTGPAAPRRFFAGR